MRFITWLINLFKVTPPPQPPVTPPVIEYPQPSQGDKLFDIVMENLGIDPSPSDNVPDDVGCADSMSSLIKKLYFDFPILVSTKDLDMKLYMDKRFQRELEPKKGRIIISPRTANTLGHVGYFTTDYKIASNTSKSGMFVENYTYDSWIKDMKIKRGLAIHIYSVV